MNIPERLVKNSCCYLVWSMKRAQYQQKTVSLSLLKRSVLKKLRIFSQFDVLYLEFKVSKKCGIPMKLSVERKNYRNR
jgi:hypothetical protein